MKYILDYDEKPYLKYFQDICAIPHVSYNEKELSDYIVQFAKDRNLWHHQDELWNVIIKKPASQGYEDHAPVMLQGHIDMVGVKTPESNHNFDTDPLELYVEDGFIKAKDTTLGADCGHGISYILSILDDTALKHPPIEALFTVQEEVGIGGPKALDYSLLSAKRLIYTDSMTEGSPEMSTTSVVGGNFIKYGKLSGCNAEAFEVKVSGLEGGHAAVDINKSRANAIKIVARVMQNLMKIREIRIGDIKGGSLKNNIPNEASIVFTCTDATFEEIENVVKKLDDDISLEHKKTDPEISITVRKGLTVKKTFDAKSSKEMIEWITLIPSGTYMQSTEIPGFPITSRNLGTAVLADDKLIIGYMFRSSLKTHIPMLMDEQFTLCKLFDAAWEEEYSYPGYSIETGSPMYNTYADVYRELAGKELIPIHIHAGTDVGTIIERMGGLDVIGIGPNTLYFHTPKEALDLESYDRAYSYITKVLERL